MNEERTTKYVTMTVEVIFHGDYYGAGEVVGQAQGWIEAGLEDRDNLRGCSFGQASVREVAGDPEGYDS